MTRRLIHARDCSSLVFSGEQEGGTLLFSSPCLLRRTQKGEQEDGTLLFSSSRDEDFFTLAVRGPRPAKQALKQALVLLHPKVYVLVLPTFGYTSHLLQSEARAAIVNSGAMLIALLTIGFISMVVYGHHLYTTGLDMDVKCYFSFATTSLVTVVLGGNDLLVML